jgi:hypothetical protein
MQYSLGASKLMKEVWEGARSMGEGTVANGMRKGVSEGETVYPYFKAGMAGFLSWENAWSTSYPHIPTSPPLHSYKANKHL